MEENLRRNVHSPLSDPDPFGSCETELTRMNSDSSAITFDTFEGSSHHCAAPFSLDWSTEWTDQQHSLYLNSLEASFVNELHSSMRLRGWSLHNDSKGAFTSSTSQNTQNMTKQFPVLQDGCRKKICLERNKLVLQSSAHSHVLAGSRLRLTPVGGCTMRDSDVYDCDTHCDEEIHVRGISKFSKWSPRIIEKHCVDCSCHQELDGCTQEVTDQNFKDEDQGASSSCMSTANVSKTAAADDDTSNDQVVPSGNFHKTDVSSSNNYSSEDKGQHELLLELPEFSFRYPNSDLHYFLRGS